MTNRIRTLAAVAALSASLGLASPAMAEGPERKPPVLTPVHPCLQAPCPPS